ncbi:MAG: methionyl-tRNA formyltransferase [Pseudomonadota bacterium]
MTATPRIVYAGTPDFAAASLTALLATGYPVIAVYTQPDRPAGRGLQLTACPVKQVAMAQGIPVFQPQHFKASEDLIALENLRADLLIVAAYGLLLPLRVLEAPRLGCVNIHASLLPRWRGAAPIQRALLAGDTETGITLMQMEKGLDTGPMFIRRPCPINPGETGGSLHDRLATLGAETLLASLPAILEGTLAGEVQDSTCATYASKLSKGEAALDWHRPARELDRQVRAFNPWPVAHTRWRGEILRVWRAVPLDTAADAPPGKVVAASPAGIEVATGEGRLQVLELQRPGKRCVTAADFLNAQALTGEEFGL